MNKGELVKECLNKYRKISWRTDNSLTEFFSEIIEDVITAYKEDTKDCPCKKKNLDCYSETDKDGKVKVKFKVF